MGFQRVVTGETRTVSSGGLGDAEHALEDTGWLKFTPIVEAEVTRSLGSGEPHGPLEVRADNRFEYKNQQPIIVTATLEWYPKRVSEYSTLWFPELVVGFSDRV